MQLKMNCARGQAHVMAYPTACGCKSAASILMRARLICCWLNEAPNVPGPRRMPRLKLLHGFHAITARLRAFPATVNEVWYDPARQDARVFASCRVRECAPDCRGRIPIKRAERREAPSGRCCARDGGDARAFAGDAA